LLRRKAWTSPRLTVQLILLYDRKEDEGFVFSHCLSRAAIQTVENFILLCTFGSRKGAVEGYRIV
jgi:hypothetical protein